MIQYLLFVTSKLLNISDVTKRIGSFFKLPIQLFYGVPYPELALVGFNRGHDGQRIGIVNSEKALARSKRASVNPDVGHGHAFHAVA